jgi:hypothetical protein
LIIILMSFHISLVNEHLYWPQITSLSWEAE